MYKYLFVFLLFLTANNIYGQRNLKTLDGSAKRSNTSRNMGTDSLYDRGTKKIAKNTKAKIVSSLCERFESIHIPRISRTKKNRLIKLSNLKSLTPLRAKEKDLKNQKIGATMIKILT